MSQCPVALPGTFSARAAAGSLAFPEFQALDVEENSGGGGLARVCFTGKPAGTQSGQQLARISELEPTPWPRGLTWGLRETGARTLEPGLLLEQFTSAPGNFQGRLSGAALGPLEILPCHSGVSRGDSDRAWAAVKPAWGGHASETGTQGVLALSFEPAGLLFFNMSLICNRNGGCGKW